MPAFISPIACLPMAFPEESTQIKGLIASTVAGDAATHEKLLEHAFRRLHAMTKGSI